MSRGVFIYDPAGDTSEARPLLTTFSYWAYYELAAVRAFPDGEPRVELIGGFAPGNNQQYIP